MHRIIILQHDGCEMGNQLWNYASIYAYCAEMGFECEDFSFFEYSRYFNVAPKSRFVKWLFFMPFREHSKRRSSFKVKVYRFLYKIFVVLPATVFLKHRIIYSRDGDGGVYYLPPSVEPTSDLLKKETSQKTLLFSQVSGGVFRNPKGLEKHRAFIEKYFQPASWVAKNVQTVVGPLREHYKTLVGVHIRQGDYVMFKGGKFAVSIERAREILDEYIVFSQKKSEDIVFILASDGHVDKKLFNGLNTEISNGSAGEDLFILALCDVVIGSDSSFGHFAAYYGNVPHIVMKGGPIDWNYYQSKNSYFINKYFTVISV